MLPRRGAASASGRSGSLAGIIPDGPPQELLVYPDLPAARRLTLLVRRGALAGGHATRGPLGLGTEFESVRDYLPDDDVRQLNWRASGRLGRPMSNQYRIEQDREVMCLVDCGRLMGTPLGDRDPARRRARRGDRGRARRRRARRPLRGDRLRRRGPRPSCGRGGGRAGRRPGALRSRADEPRQRLRARLHRVGAARRAMVLVFTDLVDLAAARSLLAAAPLLTRRHAVAIVSAEDPDLIRAARREPGDADEAYETVAAVDVLEARLAVAAQLRRHGAQVVEAPVEQLALRCVQAYLSAKARARL